MAARSRRWRPLNSGLSHRGSDRFFLHQLAMNEIEAFHYPRRQFRLGQPVENMTPVPPLRHQPVSSKQREMLRNSGMADAQRHLKPVYVPLPAAKFFNQPHAVRIA